MHYLYLVAVKKDEEIEKENILSEVKNQLEQENFCGEGGYWSNGKGDWFVMGGRWSGHLQELQLNDWNKKAKELLKIKDGEFISNQDIDDNKEELQKLWESLGGKGKNVWGRDSYNNDGEEDDCMLLDKKLFEALKKRDYPDTEVAIYENGYIQDEMLLQNFLEQKDIVNNYYLCVVDYHN